MASRLGSLEVGYLGLILWSWFLGLDFSGLALWLWLFGLVDFGVLVLVPWLW